MNIAIIVDSFKGTMSSSTIARIIEKDLVKRGHNILTMPISDGGEGLVETIETHFACSGIYVQTENPFGETIYSEYVIVDNCAYIEMSSAAGITLVKRKDLNPLVASTYGVGILIKDAILKGVKKIVLGIGGSCTNDGGAGILQSLGVEFYIEDELIMERMNGFLIGEVTKIKLGNLRKNIEGILFELASDVKNPLLGKNGCSTIYSSQKGASPKQKQILERNMISYSNIVKKTVGFDYSELEGSGAAGGVGFGCLAFLDANIYSGIEYLIDLLGIEEKIKKTDIVIVGEGKYDHQTKHGKAPHGIAKLAKKYNKKVIGVFAIVENGVESELIDEIISIVPKYATMEESFNNPESSFAKLVKDIKI